MALPNPVQRTHARIAQAYLKSARRLRESSRLAGARGLRGGFGKQVAILHALEHASAAAEHAQWGDPAKLMEAVALGVEIQSDALRAMGVAAHPPHGLGVPHLPHHLAPRPPTGARKSLRLLKGGKQNPAKKKAAKKKKGPLDIKDDHAVQLAVGAARKGKREAFGRIYTAFYPDVYRVALHQVKGGRGATTSGDHAEAEDLTQSTFITIMEKIKDFQFLDKDGKPIRQPARMFGSWIATIARNKANDWSRGLTKDAKRKAVTRLKSQVAEIAADLRGPPSITLRAESIAEAIRKTLAELPAKRRDLILMADLQGMTAEQMAENAGVARRTVVDHLMEARKDLQRRLHARLAPSKVTMEEIESMSQEELAKVHESVSAQLQAAQAQLKKVEGKKPGDNPRRKTRRNPSALRRLMRL